MAESKHTHKFRRKVYDSGNKIFYCTLPDCYFKIELGLSLGKISLCNRCNQPFEMNSYSIRLSKPHCPNCHKSSGTDNESKGNDESLQPVDPIQSLTERLAFNAPRTQPNSTQPNSSSEEGQVKKEETEGFAFKSLDEIVADDIL